MHTCVKYVFIRLWGLFLDVRHSPQVPFRAVYRLFVVGPDCQCYALRVSSRQLGHGNWGDIFLQEYIAHTFLFPSCLHPRQRQLVQTSANRAQCIVVARKHQSPVGIQIVTLSGSQRGR